MSSFNLQQRNQIVQLIKSTVKIPNKLMGGIADSAEEMASDDMRIELDSQRGCVVLSNKDHDIEIDLTHLEMRSLSKLIFTDASELRGISSDSNNVSPYWCVGCDLFYNTIGSVNSNINNLNGSLDSLYNTFNTHKHTSDDVLVRVPRAITNEQPQPGEEAYENVNIKDYVDNKVSSAPYAGASHNHNVDDIYMIVNNNGVSIRKTLSEVLATFAGVNHTHNVSDISISVGGQTMALSAMIDATYSKIGHTHTGADVAISRSDLEVGMYGRAFELATIDNIVNKFNDKVSSDGIDAALAITELSFLTSTQKEIIKSLATTSARREMVSSYVSNRMATMGHAINDIWGDAMYINNVPYNTADSGGNSIQTLGNLQDAFLNHKHRFEDLIDIPQQNNSSVSALDIVNLGVSLISTVGSISAIVNSVKASKTAEAAGAFATASQIDDITEGLLDGFDEISDVSEELSSSKSFWDNIASWFKNIQGKFKGGYQAIENNVSPRVLEDLVI